MTTLPEYYRWVFGKLGESRFGNVWLSGVVFILFASILGLVARWVWSPLMVIVGGYLLIDYLTTNALVFDCTGQGYLTFRRFTERKRKLSEVGAMLWFVVLILATAGVADLTITSAKWLDRFMPTPASVLVWDFLEGAFLIWSLS